MSSSKQINRRPVRSGQTVSIVAGLSDLDIKRPINGQDAIPSTPTPKGRDSNRIAISPDPSPCPSQLEPPDEDLDGKDPIPILYKIRLVDESRGSKANIDRFQATEFEGFEPSGEEPGRSTLSIMDDIRQFGGTLVKDRKNQQRRDFRTQRLQDPEPFVGGIDCIVREMGPRTVRIFSTKVYDVLLKEIDNLSSRKPPDGSLVYISEPFKILAWDRDRLRSICEGFPTAANHDMPYDEETRYHMNVVMGWFEKYYQQNMAQEIKLHEDEQKATFGNLWLLYKPGSVVVSSKADVFECFVVHSCEVKWLKDVTINTVWELRLWSVIHDGSSFKWQPLNCYIKMFSKAIDIIKLPVYPIKYAKGLDEQALIQRGERYYDIARAAPTHRQYSGYLGIETKVSYVGTAIIEPLMMTKGFQQKLAGKYVGPNKGMLEVGEIDPGDECGAASFSAYRDIDLSSENTVLSDDQKKLIFPLTPSHIIGYALGKKTTEVFNMQGFAQLNKPTPNRSFLANVVLPPGHLELLKRLTTLNIRARSESWISDFVKGKGLGQIFVLHGPPGTGKSLTVECLAQESGQPLLSLSVADLGTTEHDVETTLSKWLDKAQRWNAIVLIDEADIYLVRRKTGDTARNALVASLLRVLEYYPGMIFITTNRPGDLDDAFISRFHLILEYKALDQDAQRKVWSNFFEKLRQEGVGDHSIKITVHPSVQNYVEEDPRVLGLGMNGRDIRNAFQASIRVAIGRTCEELGGERVKEVELRKDDLKTVIDNKESWKTYLTKLNSKDEPERAFGDRARYHQV